MLEPGSHGDAGQDRTFELTAHSSQRCPIWKAQRGQRASPPRDVGAGGARKWGCVSLNSTSFSSKSPQPARSTEQTCSLLAQ